MILVQRSSEKLCFFLIGPFLRFPTDPDCQTIDRQFLWGTSLLISPVLEQGAAQLNAYLPKGTWYNFYNVSSSSLLNTTPLRSV